MDFEKLIDRVVAELDVGNSALKDRAILAAAFAEVRREALSEVLTAVSTWVGEGESQYGIERRLKALLPPAAEGSGVHPDEWGHPTIPDCGFKGEGCVPCGEPVYHSGCHGWCNLEYNAHEGPCRAPTAADRAHELRSMK